MDQLKLPLYGRLNGPAVAPLQYVQMCKTYREVVRLAWELRRVQYMTRQQLASEGEFYAQHVGDWLNPDDKPLRRSLPGDRIPQFQTVVGNTLITQWLAAQAELTVVEEMAATRAAA